MNVVDATGDPPPAEVVATATRALRAGHVIAIPTDTVYGLAVDAFHAGATDRLFALKRRPRGVDLPVLVADADQAMSLVADVPDIARRLMARYWPGALTLVLARNPEVTADLGADDTTIGLRCPDHALVRALCAAAGPLATTSANLHGQPTLSTAADVAATFGDAVALVLDGGTCAGAPSTVVDCTGEHPELLRQGRIPWVEVLAAAPPQRS